MCFSTEAWSLYENFVRQCGIDMDYKRHPYYEHRLAA